MDYVVGQFPLLEEKLESYQNYTFCCVLRFSQKLEARVKVIALKLKRVSMELYKMEVHFGYYDLENVFLAFSFEFCSSSFWKY
jgi:hypothetical protein